MIISASQRTDIPAFLWRMVYETTQRWICGYSQSVQYSPFTSNHLVLMT